MIEARWTGQISFDAFMDHDRETIGSTAYRKTSVEESVKKAKSQIFAWANSYNKNRWENQPNYVEIFIEKKALQGVFESPCEKWDVALNPCKGYPSLTFLYDASERFKKAETLDKKPTILYFGDYDPSGEDIPRSIKENLWKLGIEVDLIRVALMENQVVDWKLPPAPTKDTDTRSGNWDGLGQVELDAVEPPKIVKLLNDSIETVFDYKLHDELLDIEQKEQIEFKSILRNDFNSIL